MPRHAKKRSKVSGMGHSGNAVVRVPFRMVRYYTTDTTNWDVAYIQLRPDQLGTRLTAIKDTYNLFRCTSLRVKSVFPYMGIDNTTQVVHGCGFNQQYLPNNPSYWDAMAQFGRLELDTGSRSVSFRLNRNELIGQDPLKWWRTNEAEPTTPPALEDFTTQGYLYWASERRNGLASVRHLLLLEGVMEFCQPKDTALDTVHRCLPAVGVLEVDEKGDHDQAESDSMEEAVYLPAEIPVPPGTAASGPPQARASSTAVSRRLSSR